MSENNTKIQYPTFVGLECPKCGNTEFKINGTKNSTMTGIKNASNVAFLGALGNIVTSASSEKDFDLRETKFQCSKCKNKFDSLPNAANTDEILEKPCTVTFKRLSSLIGGAVTQQVFLNGVKVGSVKNGDEIKFNTYTKNNVVFVTDHNGNAFKGDFKFTAESGGHQEIKFKRKFV